MRNYELVLVFRTSLSEADRTTVIDGIKVLLKDLKVVAEKNWGSKVLSYPIKHEETGYYVDILLETEKSIPTDFEKRLIDNDKILRHLVIRTK